MKLVTACPQIVAAVFLLYYALTFQLESSAFVHRMLVESCPHQTVLTLLVLALVRASLETALSLCCSFPSYWCSPRHLVASEAPSLLTCFGPCSLVDAAAPWTSRAVASPPSSRARHRSSRATTTTCTHGWRSSWRAGCWSRPWRAWARRTRSETCTRATGRPSSWRSSVGRRSSQRPSPSSCSEQQAHHQANPAKAGVPRLTARQDEICAFWCYCSPSCTLAP